MFIYNEHAYRPKTQITMNQLNGWVILNIQVGITKTKVSADLKTEDDIDTDPASAGCPGWPEKDRCDIHVTECELLVSKIWSDYYHKKKKKKLKNKSLTNQQNNLGKTSKQTKKILQHICLLNHQMCTPSSNLWRDTSTLIYEKRNTHYRAGSETPHTSGDRSAM